MATILETRTLRSTRLYELLLQAQALFDLYDPNRMPPLERQRWITSGEITDEGIVTTGTGERYRQYAQVMVRVA